MKNFISVCIAILLSVLIVCFVSGCNKTKDGQKETSQKVQKTTSKKVQQTSTADNTSVITVAKASTTTAHKSNEEPTLSTTQKTVATTEKKFKRPNFNPKFDNTKKTFNFPPRSWGKNPGMQMSSDAVDKFYNAIKAIDFKSKEVSAVVGGENIYKYQVLEAKAIEDFSFNRSAFPSFGKGKEENTKNNPKTEKEFLDELIESAVIVQKAKETGVSAISKENLDKQVESHIKFMKMDDNHYKKTLEAYNMTEEEYKKKLSAQYEITHYTNQYRFKFFEGIENRFSKENIDEYEKHIEDLVKQANVQYK